MIKNYFKTAWRNLLRSRGFSIINIAGLAIGMAAAALIIFWINSQLAYDQFHEKKDRIYQLWNKAEFNGTTESWNTTPKILARTMERELPEVERAVRVDWPGDYLFSVDDKKITLNGLKVDTGFLQMFSYPLIHGDENSALNNTYSVLVTESAAKKLFVTKEAMGKIVKIDNEDNFTITGIIKDPPPNSRFRFEYLIPWSYLVKKGQDDSLWGNNSTANYVLLKQGASVASVNSKLKTIKYHHTKKDEFKNWEFFLYPLDRWKLYSKFTNGKEDGGLIEFVRLFSVIAVFILLIACINFMNLSTARSERRAKEVGIRKAVGAEKSSLFFQFIGESVLLAMIAGVLAFGLIYLALPAFSKLVDEKLSIPISDGLFWLKAVAFVFFTGIIAGSYPALFMSSFNPVKALKGTYKAPNAIITPRKALVVLQFTFAIVLIIGTIIVKRQIEHARNRDAGYNKNNLGYHYITGDLGKNYNLVKNELLSSGVATSVTKTGSPITEGWTDSWGFSWEGKAPDDKTDFDRFFADEGLGRTAGLTFVKGRDFDLAKYPTDSAGMIINESAARVMNFKDPIGKIVKDGERSFHIVGVIKDFILQSPYQPMKPMVIRGAKNGWFSTIHFKLNSAHQTSDNLKKAETIFKKYNPSFPFEYKFVDEEYQVKFKEEQKIGILATLFASLAIFISCLGLFALATYMAENRVKEIGVRKVLGASVVGITALLSKDFLKLVLISFVIACPVAWWLMFKWLQNYPYRTNIGWQIFFLAGCIAVTIALVAVVFQAIKAALANPVKSLRTE